MERDPLENEREWRRFLASEVATIKRNQDEMMITMTTIKIKIGFISSIFGAIGAIVVGFVTKKY